MSKEEEKSASCMELERVMAELALTDQKFAATQAKCDDALKFLKGKMK